MVLWGAYPKLVALSGNIVLAFCLIFFISNGFELVGQLYISEDEAVSNKIADEKTGPQDGMAMFRKNYDVSGEVLSDNKRSF